MFRELARKANQLSENECIEILKNETRGVLSVCGENGYPYGTPMNHFYYEKDGCIYFHCGKQGHRLDSLKINNKVSFCVYDKGERKAGEWAFTVKSVVVFGKVDIIDDEKVAAEMASQLCRKFTQDDEYIKREIALYAHKTLILRLTPEHMCGKRVKEE
ncbi:MAG: pyridoxamine 5'-phosphate oxidase family protein [Ruminococcaceae bacterium]|nr:pyridoxamine 5'-phosphate oxidase family protein [Oscillospiraceae bacterium]